ncbi:MAG TPA: aldo/keto reductase [Chloroflexota bacterium]|nr:aldo/keto reductase [Chloroflexota bacterium]
MIATQPFGRTGHASSRVIFGAAALGEATQDQADQTLELLLRHGVNHIDVAASYGDAELRVGPWMAEHRDHFFLATKTGKRDYQAAREEIHRSLERLRVDRLDLLQLHNLADPIEWDIALSPGGALDAAIEAREEGLVRFIGVTGHGTQIAATHIRSLGRYDFDSVLLPYSFITNQNSHYTDRFEALAALCAERNAAVQTIKSIARRPWSGRPHTHTTWYEPLTEQADVDLAVHWVLGRDRIFLNTVGDLSLLPKVLDAAERVSARPSTEEMRAAAQRWEAVPLFV